MIFFHDVTDPINRSREEIAFLGDVLNTSARIESECNNLNRRFLISEDLAIQSNLPGLDEVGTVKLRGKQKEKTFQPCLAINGL
jgi:adenylate cyclase